MTLAQIVILNLFVLLAVLGGVVTVLFIAYANQVKRIQGMHDDIRRLRTHFGKHSKHLIEEAHEKSLHILGEANLKAQEIINKTAFVDEKMRGDLKAQLFHLTKIQEEELARITSELSHDHQNLLGSLSIQNQDLLKEASKEMEVEVLGEVARLKESLETETVKAKEIARNRVQEEYKKVEAELDTYKVQKMQEVDAKAQLLIKEVAKQVLGRSLTYQDHEDIVMKMLAEAKGRGEL